MPRAGLRGLRYGGPAALLLVALLFSAPLAPRSAANPSTANGCPPPAAGGAPAGSQPPAPQPAPQQILVCVGAQAITGAIYSHWLTVAERAEPLPSKGPSAPGANARRGEVLAFLISSYWVEGEARDLHIRVSAGEVRRSFDRLRGQAFPKRGEFRAFLRQSGQTVADLLLRTRLNLTSTRIQRRILSSGHGAGGGQRALARFLSGFRAKWRAQTYCAGEYAVSDCGHVQSIL
jgi:hypothetical protein